MKMFTCGPVQMFPSTMIIRNKGYIYFRTQEFGDMVKKGHHVMYMMDILK